jgi:hypothetical protein
MNTDDLDLEQYRALRGEILRVMEDGNQVMSFGLAAIGIVISAGFTAKDTQVGFILFAGIVPLLSALVLSMWFASYERLSRASYFITGIEERLKRSINRAELLTWDTWLRMPSKKSRSQHHFWSTENSGVLLFAFLFIASIGLSVFSGDDTVNNVWRYTIYSVDFVGFVAFSLLMRVRMQRTKKWFTSIFGDLE